MTEQLLIEWVLAALGILTAISTLISWLTRQQMLVNKLEMDTRLAAMELRLTEKIGQAFCTWQAHNDLSDRVSKLENRAAWPQERRMSETRSS